MIFYLSIFAIIVLMRFAMGEYARTNRRIYYFVLISLFLISALRFEVGCDWFGYVEYLDQQKGATFLDAFGKREWLWYVFLEIFDRLGLDVRFLNVATSAAFFAGVSVFARRQPDPVGFLVLLFPILIINLPMSGIRQGVAVGLICVAFCSFLDKRWVSFLIWTLIASSIHSSAFIFLMLVPFCLNLKPKTQLQIAAVLAIPGLALLVSSSAADVAFTRYVGTDIEAAGAAYRVVLIFATSLVFLFVLRRSWAQLFPYDYQLMELGALMMLATIALLPLSSVIADRAGYYLIPLQAAMLSRIPFLPIRSGRPLFFLAPYAAFLAVFLTWMSLSHLFALCYTPYETWLFGQAASQ